MLHVNITLHLIVSFSLLTVPFDCLYFVFSLVDRGLDRTRRTSIGSQKAVVTLDSALSDAFVVDLSLDYTQLDSRWRPVTRVIVKTAKTVSSCSLVGCHYLEQESQAYKLAYGEMQCAIALEMKYKRLRYSHSLAEAVVLEKQFTTALSSCCAYQSNVV